MTDHYAVIGNPIAHSKSPEIHNAFARQTAQDIEYTRILAPLDGFKAEVEKFRDAGGKGLNVTVPFKHDAWNIVRSQGYARNAGAVNTIKFRDGLMLGYNTDGIGLVRDIRDNLRFPIKGARVLIMGAGGAAHGVLEPLLKESPEHVVIANRTLEKAEELIKLTAKFNGVDGVSLSSISAQRYEGIAGKQFDLVINATSAGLIGDMPPLPDDLFAKDSLAYEMVYGKTTPFMQFATAHDAATVVDGLGMLVEQAAESFFIWREVRPQTAPVIEMLRRTV
jgi:shikimate dehydrogenase